MLPLLRKHPYKKARVPPWRVLQFQFLAATGNPRSLHSVAKLPGLCTPSKWQPPNVKGCFAAQVGDGERCLWSLPCSGAEHPLGITILTPSWLSSRNRAWVRSCQGKAGWLAALPCFVYTLLCAQKARAEHREFHMAQFPSAPGSLHVSSPRSVLTGLCSVPGRGLPLSSGSYSNGDEVLGDVLAAGCSGGLVSWLSEQHT